MYITNTPHDNILPLHFTSLHSSSTHRYFVLTLTLFLLPASYGGDIIKLINKSSFDITCSLLRGATNQPGLTLSLMANSASTTIYTTPAPNDLSYGTHGMYSCSVTGPTPSDYNDRFRPVQIGWVNNTGTGGAANANWVNSSSCKGSLVCVESIATYTGGTNYTKSLHDSYTNTWKDVYLFTYTFTDIKPT